jgi:hypothetical protein
MIGARSGGSVVTLAELVAAAETRATEIISVTLRSPIIERFFTR